MVAKKGGKAVIIRSLSSATDDAPHTGAMKYEDGTEKYRLLLLVLKELIILLSYYNLKNYSQTQFKLRNERGSNE